ncbi:DsbA family protein [Hydrogenophaga sp. PAMC20947]|uniref:DsbA family oxidoreductase n=1 Tax=Hydrogenophaga sp. PAMC20947 TaxID=2565558 RepID=UPI00109DE46D|nr:DsbA family protein [Hydrogenophaga sp. PAMC20947]QCB45395.1 disulfide bond formation protein DsbA [Hydrogenophaga sp. PAMC20947]
MQPTLTVSYFSDVLCVWAYAAQVKLDELQRQFGDQIRVEYRFLHLFGDVAARIETGWGDKGGAAGYSRQVQKMAVRFDHIAIHPEIWTRNVPPTSVSCHLFLKAIQLLEKQGEVSAAPEERFGGKSAFEEAVWRCRLAFFRDLQDIADRKVQEAMASDMELPLAAIQQQIDSGAAHAALCADFDAKDRQQVEGSPTFVLNEGRQKLYGNVGYRIVEASIHELLVDPGDRASWC